jgi:hypothetical protein
MHALIILSLIRTEWKRGGRIESLSELGNVLSAPTEYCSCSFPALLLLRIDGSAICLHPLHEKQYEQVNFDCIFFFQYWMLSWYRACKTEPLFLIKHVQAWTPWCWAVLRVVQLCSYPKTSQHFMGHETSLPCSQEPSTPRARPINMFRLTRHN